MSDEKKNIPWGKILKLFFEFLIAAIVAIFGTSCVMSAKAGELILPFM